MREHRDAVVLVGLVAYFLTVATGCAATGYYLPVGLAVLMAVVLGLALSAMSFLALTLDADLGSRRPPSLAVSVAVGLTTVATIGGCALGVTLAG